MLLPYPLKSLSCCHPLIYMTYLHLQMFIFHLAGIKKKRKNTNSDRIGLCVKKKRPLWKSDLWFKNKHITKSVSTLDKTCVSLKPFLLYANCLPFLSKYWGNVFRKSRAGMSNCQGAALSLALCSEVLLIRGQAKTIQVRMHVGNFYVFSWTLEKICCRVPKTIVH